MANVLTHVESRIDQGTEEEKFVIVKIGDSSSGQEGLPVVAKSRPVMKKDNNESYSSIVCPLRMDRHFDEQFGNLKNAKDTPWEE